jgi:hypothetical protein
MTHGDLPAETEYEIKALKRNDGNDAQNDDAEEILVCKK